MTPQMIADIQSSWLAALAAPGDITAVFYDRLFATAPQVRPLSRNNLALQRLKLADTLATVVEELDNFERLRGTVADLGRRHVRYGARPEHYAAVGEALIWALERHLGPDFTDDARNAWTEAIRLLVGIMIDATRAAPAR
ncbi:hemin receptor [Paroceanicella profunda]|uniref:Hemin receptor n=1 Tax=Paroceanicella profunda TaxID=2579971 RepID=A0A5B8FG41_9RHOB|nr:globin domain-containing protein [Paroceanicella profunda]QDL90388.1 hemin receptor [Paroceanicella profunda]